jgi:hypothetical protein
MSPATASNLYGQVTLSSIINSESDKDFTVAIGGNSLVNLRQTVWREKTVSYSVKTPAYLTYRTATAILDIYMVGSDSKTTIRAVCALL